MIRNLEQFIGFCVHKNEYRNSNAGGNNIIILNYLR